MVAIARAAFKSAPKLAIFDEPEASLDAIAEASLQRLFLEVAATLTTRGGAVLIATHRRGVAMTADCVVVLDGGCIVEQGSPHDLSRASGPFAQLFSLGSGPRAPGLGHPG